MGSFAIPNIFVFQIFFPLISPFMDLALLISMGWAFWQRYHHPVDYSLTHTFQNLLFYYLFFLAVDMLAAVIVGGSLLALRMTRGIGNA